METLTNEEYEQIRLKDYDYAKSLYDTIQECRDIGVRYRDSRPIMNVKHMVETSASDQWYGDHDCFWQKFDHKGEYEPITYKEMLKTVNCLGTALIARGLKDARISVTGENCSQWAMAFLSVICGTGVVVPLDKELTEEQLTEQISRAEVKAVFCRDKLEPTFVSIREKGETGLSLIINLDKKEDTETAVSYCTLIEEGRKLLAEGDRSFLDARIDAEDLAQLLFTSGTTGKPKGVMLSHRNLITDLMVAPTVLTVHDWDIFFSVLPLHHTYECTCGFLMPIYKGAAIAYCEGLKYIADNLKEARPTMFLGVPAIFEALYKKIWKTAKKEGKDATLRKGIAINNKLKKVHIDLSRFLFKDVIAVFGGRMRMMISGGAAINPEVLEFIQALGIQAVQGYGLTECAPMGALNPDTAAKAASCGKRFPATDIRIHEPDENGIGEIWLHGGNVMMGYYQNEEATAEAVTDGWFHTGDLGYLDEEGYCYITGRQKNVILTKNGENIFPEELEYFLSVSDLISESMVFSEATSDGRDERICATLVPDMEEVREVLGKDPDPASLEELLWDEVDKVNAELPYFKRIKKIVVRREPLVKNTSNKVIRFVEENRKEA